MNGKPQCGKTTFAEQCKEYINSIECALCHTISTIDPIKEIYKKLGWDGTKTDKARKDLSTLKKMWIDNCNGPLKYVVDYVLRLDSINDHVIFVDIREESEIIALTDVLNALNVINIRYHVVLVERPDTDGFEYGNKSDDMVGNNRSLYDIGIDNSGTLGDLTNAVHNFINDLLDIDYSNYMEDN